MHRRRFHTAFVSSTLATVTYPPPTNRLTSSPQHGYNTCWSASRAACARNTPPRHVCAETPRTPRSRRPHALPAPPLTYTTTFTPGRCPWPHGGRPPTPPTCPPRGLQTYSASRWLGGLHNSAKIQHMHCKRWANLDGRWGQQLACAGSIQQLCANFVPTVNNTHVRVCV